jgi:hypothetical protein
MVDPLRSTAAIVPRAAARLNLPLCNVFGDSYPMQS